MPSKPSRPTHTSKDFELPDEKHIDLSSGKEVIDDGLQFVTGETMEDDRLKNLLREEKSMRDFMEQKVKFMIAETDDENAPNPVACGVNGVHRYFHRGTEYIEARKFIDSLIKVVNHVKTVNYKDKDGIDQTDVKTRPVLAYTISILEDPAGQQGLRWFQHQQRNAF